MRHITAAFPTEDKAASAVTELQALGAMEVMLDFAPRFEFASTGWFAMLPPGTISSGSFGGPGAGGFASGLPDGLAMPEEQDDRGVPMVTAAVDERKASRAEAIVRRNGGKLL